MESKGRISRYCAPAKDELAAIGRSHRKEKELKAIWSH